jgi:hypothetical protein
VGGIDPRVVVVVPNRYPGCSVDTPSNLHCTSFYALLPCPNPRRSSPAADPVR